MIRMIILGIGILFIVTVIFIVMCCLIMASRADDEIEKEFTRRITK